ncbi:MAG: UDP-N-acetylmuramoyl-L-alanine--D-glutamate ligase [Candidatus Omnitrophica bacterium]|nr:UDP-N-acetylmuramoyl-L-alanine--D-glutamate ligase [Candidatus Omnitrophota bacterium]
MTKFTTESLKGKNVLVIGLGASGFHSAEFLIRYGARVKVTESEKKPIHIERKKILEDKGVKVELGGHTKSFFNSIDLAVISPGIDPRNVLSLFEVEIPIISELELGVYEIEEKFIAITGTNGKSTACRFVEHALKTAGVNAIACGNIGLPVTAIEWTKKDLVAVIEVSSFQLEYSYNFKPHVAILLNVTDDHFERHNNIEEYKKQKFKIFAAQDENDWAIVHDSLRNDPLVSTIKSKIIFYNSNSIDSTFDVDKLGFNTFMKLLNKVSLPPSINKENIIAGGLSAIILNLSMQNVVSSLATFTPLSHRMEQVADFDGVLYIDDSKATNIGSCEYALNSLLGNVILIAGGVDKGGDYSTIVPLIEKKVKKVVVLGEAAGKIQKALTVCGIEIYSAKNMRDAVLNSCRSAIKGDTVLLSPMCSSFDMYENYKERGKDFKNEVLKLKTVHDK